MDVGLACSEAQDKTNNLHQTRFTYGVVDHRVTDVTRLVLLGA